jgi:type VI protein secretion system component VasF
VPAVRKPAVRKPAVRKPRRRSARLRLTLWYGGLAMATGAVLLTANYLLVRHSLDRKSTRLNSSHNR